MPSVSSLRTGAGIEHVNALHLHQDTSPKMTNRLPWPVFLSSPAQQVEGRLHQVLALHRAELSERPSAHTWSPGRESASRS